MIYCGSRELFPLPPFFGGEGRVRGPDKAGFHVTSIPQDGGEEEVP